jgi:glycosyltransferase involved in cell wall biosynthesis
MDAVISIIIPAYNEEERIQTTIEDLCKNFTKKSYEIIVSAEDSTDETSNIVKKLMKKNKHIKLLNSNKTIRLGKGKSLQRGFEKSTGKIIVFADADLSANAKELKKLISFLNKYDVAIGSRAVKGSKVKATQIRKFLGRGFIFGVNLLLNLNIKDTQCGYKAFKRDVLNNVFHKVISSGWEFDVELLWKIKKAKYTIIEVPINWIHKDKAKLKAIDIFNMGWGVLKIKWRS